MQTTDHDQNQTRHKEGYDEKVQNYAWMSFNKILVIGLGQLGLPVAKYVKDRGFDV
ncbi:MAG: hypothetical protein WAM88_01690 [Nitrososphaeraceae archaeon]